jgi:hypothetical protein
VIVLLLRPAAVREEVESLERRYAFGAGLDLDLLGFELDDSTLVPGVAVESSRAKPLAGKFVPNIQQMSMPHSLFRR